MCFPTTSKHDPNKPSDKEALVSIVKEMACSLHQGSGAAKIIVERWSLEEMFRQRRELHRLENTSTSGNERTPAPNFASNGEILSFRQTRDNGNDRFKSVTGSNTTPSGHRQRI